ncbi:MAG: AAA family ATPase [Pseudomonas sp.]|nr:AAA family ATPase [Pseudomonas sp.]
MRLVLENIGMLKNAELNLESLSVIAGENDNGNGKSTVGKVVFCIVKAINRYKEDLQESKEYKINEKLDQVYFDLRRALMTLVDEPTEVISRVSYLRDPELKSDYKLQLLHDDLLDLESRWKIDERSLHALKQSYSELLKLVNEPENTKKSIENALNKVFTSEFDSSVLLNGEEQGFIRLFEDDLKLIDIKVSAANKIKLLSDVEPVELKDATFIESPLILNNHDLLIRSQSGLNLSKRSLSRLGMPYTTLHTKDLFDKLKELPLGELFDSEENTVFRDSIHRIVNGEIIYDNDKKDFIFNKDGKSISIKNTASGIKVFGILQLLSKNSFLNKNSMLIFDEPENHLHPNWQLKLAKILVELAKNGVYVLVSSHSPYMIEALKRFSDSADLEQKTGFYLAENNTIENRNRLEDTFRILSEPFEIFRKMDEELLKDE